MRNTLVVLIAASIVALVVSRTWADGVVRDSVGPTSSGRGGTNIAHADNGSIILSNPAALVNIPTQQMSEFGVDTLLTDLKYTDAENRDNARSNPFVLPEAAVMERSRDGRWAVGLGFFVPAGFGATWDLNSRVLGKRRFETFAAVGKVLPSAAVRVTDRLSVGATLGVAVSHAEVESPFFVQTGALAGAPTLLDLQGTGAAPTWSVGLQYQVSDRTTIGAAYVSETRFRLDGRAGVDAFVIPGAPPVRSRFDLQLDMVWPRSAGVGITHRLSDNQRVSLDVLWFDWSSAFDRIDMEFRNPTNPFFAPLGPRIRDSLPLDWKDSVSVRMGYEYFFRNRNVLRLGYVHNSQTVRSSTLTPFIPATLEHTVSVGYGHWLPGNARLDLAYQWAIGPNDGPNQSRLVGGEFDNSEVEVQAHWIFVGVTKFY